MPHPAGIANRQIHSIKRPVTFETLELLEEGARHPAAVNMAVDEVLLRQTRVPILRVYGWQKAAVTFGYFEKWAPLFAEFPDREIIRRWTGGGVVHHGRDWTYSLIIPRPFVNLPPPESYRRIHQKLGEALNGNFMVAPQAAKKKMSAACFENPARYDLLAGEHKIAGAAQRRSRFGLLHQGSVQGCAIPEGLAQRFAACLARKVTPRTFEDLPAAEALAAAKNATETWNRKY